MGDRTMGWHEWQIELLAGSVAGVSQDMLMHPADTLRARLDVAPSKTTVAPFRALLETFRTTLQADGIRGLYGGYGMAVMASVPANALYFGGYKFYKRLMGTPGGKPEPAVEAAAGLASQFTANILWTPLDVIKQRLQVAPPGLTTMQTVNAVVNKHGVTGLWRGYWVGNLVWGPFSASYFCVYEALARLACPDPGPKPFAVTFCSGVVASGVSGLLTQPMDCLKTRIQVGTIPLGVGLVPATKKLLVDEGWAVLFRGAAARVLWLAPGGGITIAVFEKVIAELNE